MLTRKRLKIGAAVIALFAIGALAYSVYGRLPVGKELTRYDVVGDVDRPIHDGWQRPAIHHYGTTMLLTSGITVTEENMAAFARGVILDTQIPDLREQLAKQRKAFAVSAAASAIAAGETQLAQSAFADAVSGVGEKRGTIFLLREREGGGGRFDLVASLPTGYWGSVDLIATPGGGKIYWITDTDRVSGKDGQPNQPNIFRSDDQGAHWVLDSSIQLDRSLEAVTFLNQDRAVALTKPGSFPKKDVTLRYSQSGAREWSTVAIRKLVWPDADTFQGGDNTYTNYFWSLYPVGEDQAVGWSCRVLGSQSDSFDEKLLETHRFDIRFRGEETPTITVTRNVPSTPKKENVYKSLTQRQHPYEIVGDRIFAIDKASLTWREISRIPSVRGRTPWIVESWLGDKAWVVLAITDTPFSRRHMLSTYFYSLDQGKTWHAFKLSVDQRLGLAGIDDTSAALLILWRAGDKTELRRYPLE